jgi:trimeric autotransporter adhesin
LQIGFLAQDVEAAAKASGFNFPGIDAPRNSKEVYTLRYVDFIMPMVKAIQQQQVIIDNLKSEKEAQAERIKLMEKQNEEILKRLAALENK